MSNKTKDVKVEVETSQRDLEFTTYQISVTVPTNQAIVMEWLTSQNAIEPLNSYISKAIATYFHQSSNQIKQALATGAKKEKLASKKPTNKKAKSTEKKELPSE